MTLNISNIMRSVKSKAACKTMSKLEKLSEQVTDSAIVGGITWLSVGATTAINGHPVFSWEGFAFGFGLTFLIKMKEYRKIV